MSESSSIKRPKKSETLARKVEERTYRRRLLARVSDVPAKKWVRIGEVLSLLAIFLINFWLLLPFFGEEDKVNVFSAPLIPFLTNLISFLTPYPFAVRWWLLIFLLFFPFSFYFFVREISGRKLAALISTLIITLPVGVFWSLRIRQLLTGDGALVASLTLTLLNCLILFRFLRRGNFKTGIVSSFGVALVALTSPLGLVVFFGFALMITFSEMLLGRGRLKLFRFLTVLVLVVGFSAFWYNPEFVLLILKSSQGQLIKKTFTNLLPPSFFLIPLLGVFGFLLFENRPQLQPLFLALFSTIGFGMLSLGGASVHFSAPSRFLPAFGISLAFLIGVLTVSFFDFLRHSPRLNRFKIPFSYRHKIAYGLLGLLFTLIIVTIAFYSKTLWEIGEARSLGLTKPQKVGLWEIKEKTTLIASFFGYVITGITLLGVGFLKRKLGGQENRELT